ncbi:hypothetical protein BJX76DRAFT_346425 [Aspergillus varians]
MVDKTCLPHDEYTVGWICALPLEMAAAQALLDEVHQDLAVQPNDHNTYTLGRIGEHNVVIACLPSGIYGTSSATAVAMQLLSSFGSIRLGLMVGIGGGIPNKDADIRLGDVVVSKPTDTHGGVVQYDYGKALTQSAGDFQRTGILNQPPQVLLTALAKLQANHLTGRARFLDFLAEIEHNQLPGHESTFAHPTLEDCLYQADYEHIFSNCKTCSSCDPTKRIPRPPRKCPNVPVVHYGLIASANQVVKDSQLRDRLNHELGAYCVEMEAAGLMNNYPCLVVRGICDYADSHKNKRWQGYAAAAATAFAKEVLLLAPGIQTRGTKVAQEAVLQSDIRFRVPMDLRDVPAIDEFVGRQNELDCLWAGLQPGCSPMRKVAILHGLGGIGKSQLAIRFARIHKDDFSGIFWLNGKDWGALTQSLASAYLNVPEGKDTKGIIDEEEVKRRAQSMMKWLATAGNSRWLLIFDNVDQYSPKDSVNLAGGRHDICDFFPAADHGSIIITTRLLQLVELEDAIRLLLRISSHNHEMKKIMDPANEDIHELASLLDGLPLAIMIAASYIRQAGMSISQYLRHYRESWRDLMLNATPSRYYSQGNILTTWLVTYEEIHKSHPKSADLLLLIACFDNRDIWFELVQGCSRSGWFLDIVSSELRFVATLKPLINFSLIKPKQGGGSYSMHPVVQEWCLHAFNDNDNDNVKKLDKFKGWVLAAIGNIRVPLNEVEASKMQQRLLPHADRMLQLLRRWEVPEEPEIGMAIHDLGCVYLSQGKLKEAEELYQQALSIKEQLFGPDHRSTLESVNNLGLVYTNRRKIQEAEVMCQRALVGREKLLGRDNTATLHSVNSKGFLYTSQGKLSQAELMYKRALAGFEKELGQDSISTLDTVNNLGLLYTRQNKLQQAATMYHRAMAGFKKALGPDHTSTLIIANNLGSLYQSQGKLLEAEHMYEQALVGYERNIENLTKARGALPEAKCSNNRQKREKQVAAPQPSSAQPRSQGLGSVSYVKQGSLTIWWECCQCGDLKRPGFGFEQIYRGQCLQCHHGTCTGCRTSFK